MKILSASQFPCELIIILVPILPMREQRDDRTIRFLKDLLKEYCDPFPIAFLSSANFDYYVLLPCVPS